jgi:hypothetical protein
MSTILGKSIVHGLYDELVDKLYLKVEVDNMPVIEMLEKLEYQNF